MEPRHVTASKIAQTPTSEGRTAATPPPTPIERQPSNATWRQHLGSDAECGHESEIVMASYAPHDAGEFIVSASNDCTAILWERQNGGPWRKANRLGNPSQEPRAQDVDAMPRRPRNSHTDKVTSASFAQDCTSSKLRIATSSEDGTAIVWHLTLDGSSGDAPRRWHIDTVAELRPADKVGGPKLRCVAWSPCSDYLLTTSWGEGITTEGDNCVQVWRLEEKKNSDGTPSKVAGAPSAAAAAAATATDGEADWVRDREGVSWKARKLATLPHTGWVWSAEFAPDDAATIVSASSDKRAIVWRSYGVAQEFGSYDPDKKRWSYNSDDPDKPDVALWEREEELPKHWEGGAPEQVMYNGSTGEWEKQSCEETRLEREERRLCCSRDVATDGARPSRWCMRYTRATGLEGWRLSSTVQHAHENTKKDPTWKCAHPHMYGELKGVRGHSEWVVSAKFSPEWHVLDRSARSGWFSRGVPHTGSRIGDPNEEGSRKTKKLAAGAFIITASYDKTAILWSMATLQPITTFRSHTEKVWSAAFAHKRPMVVTASADSTIRVWDIGAKACIATLEYKSAVYSARFDATDRYVAVALKGGGEGNVAEVVVDDLQQNEDILCLRCNPSEGESQSTDAVGQIFTCDYARGSRMDSHRSFALAGSGATGELRVVNAKALQAKEWRYVDTRSEARPYRRIASQLSLGAITNAAAASVDSAGGNSFQIALDTEDYWSPEKETGHKTAVYCVAFSPDGRRLVTGSKRGIDVEKKDVPATVIIWEFRLGTATKEKTHWVKVGEIPVPLDAGSVESCCFDPHSTFDEAGSPVIVKRRLGFLRSTGTHDGEHFSHLSSQNPSSPHQQYHKVLIASGMKPRRNGLEGTAAASRGACAIYKQKQSTIGGAGGLYEFELERKLPLLNVKTTEGAWTRGIDVQTVLVDWAEFSPVSVRKRLVVTCSKGCPPSTDPNFKHTMPPCVVWDVSDEDTTDNTPIVKTLSAGVCNARWSPDGKCLATVNVRGNVAVYDTARDYEQRWSIKVSTTRLFTLSWSHDSRFVAMGGLDKRAFVVDVADAEVRTTFVGEPGDELGVITCVSFSRSSTMLAVTTNLGRVYFVPTRPFGTRGTVNALRAKARLINLSASFAKSLNWLNAAAPWAKPGKAGERGQTGATRAGRWAPSRNGATALHLLADMHTSGDFWGNSPAKSQQVNEPVVTAWADADVPYFPVCNADGATPLEVAVAAKNHLFTSYLLDREKGTKGVMWNTDPTWKHAASFRPDLITARDLSMLLEWPSALGYAVQYIAQPKLLCPASSVVTEGLATHAFTANAGTFELFEVTGAPFGPACRRGLWADFSEGRSFEWDHNESRNDSCERICTLAGWIRSCHQACSCRRRRLQSPTEAFYVSIEGIAGAGKGHDVLWQLVFGDASTLAAFSGPAMRYVVAHRWKEIGYFFYAVRLRLYLIFVGLQTWLSIEVSYRENESDHAREDPNGFWRRRSLCIALLLFCVGWAMDELIQISVAGRFARRCSLFRGDEKQGRYSGNFPATKEQPCGKHTPRLLRMQSCGEIGSPVGGSCRSPTLCIAMRNDVVAAIEGVRLWVGVLNVIDMLSIICTSSAAALDLVLIASSDEDRHGVAQGLMAAAGLLAWMRFFEQVRGSTRMGFYSRLIQRSILDIMPFALLLGVVLLAFSTALAPLTPTGAGGANAMNDKDLGVWGGTVENAPVAKFLQLIHLNVFATVEQFDVQSGAVATASLDSSAQLAQVLVYVFILVVPIVMLNMLVSILGQTFDEVMESRERVTLQDLAEITLTAEAWWRSLAFVCCCRAPCVNAGDSWCEALEMCKPGTPCRKVFPLLPFHSPSFDDYIRPRWFPEWLHVLRPRGEDYLRGGKPENEATQIHTQIEQLRELLLVKNAHVEAAMSKQGKQLTAAIEALQQAGRH